MGILERLTNQSLQYNIGLPSQRAKKGIPLEQRGFLLSKVISSSDLPAELETLVEAQITNSSMQCNGLSTHQGQ